MYRSDKSDLNQFGFHWSLRSNRLTFYICKTRLLTWKGQGQEAETLVRHCISFQTTHTATAKHNEFEVSIYNGVDRCFTWHHPLEKQWNFFRNFPGMLVLTERLLVLLILSLLFLPLFLIRGEAGENGSYKPIAVCHLIFKTIMGWYKKDLKIEFWRTG